MVATGANGVSTPRRRPRRDRLQTSPLITAVRSSTPAKKEDEDKSALRRALAVVRRQRLGDDGDTDPRWLRGRSYRR